MAPLTPPGGYDELLRDVREILATARARAYQAIDNLRVQAYWQVGERIVREEQGGAARATASRPSSAWRAIAASGAAIATGCSSSTAPIRSSPR